MDLNKKQAHLQRYLEGISPEKGKIEALFVRESTLEAFDDEKIESEKKEAKAGLELMMKKKALLPTHLDALEAIILPAERPVVDIKNNSFKAPDEPFSHFGTPPFKANIEKSIPGIGRIELPGHPTLPYGGTGFVVGGNLLMTNRHVAELFALGVGREGLSYRSNQRAGIDFIKEIDTSKSRLFMVDKIVMIHPYWDMALLSVDGLEDIQPLTLSTTSPGDLHGRDIAVVGYPAMDPRNNVELQNRIFRHQYNVKRLQPGRFRGVKEINSFGHLVPAITHDSSTLGGNSGSAVVDVETGHVAALHFAGIYLKANYAVPSCELGRDGRVADSGIHFDSEVKPEYNLWKKYWHLADPAPVEEPDVQVTADTARLVSPDVSAGPSATMSIPLEITIRLGTGGVDRSPGDVVAAEEKTVEPYHDKNYVNRQGYDADFLGAVIPLPEVSDDSALSKLDNGSYVIPYNNFSIVMNKKRRLALFTAANIDGSPDKRKPEPDKVYTRRMLARMEENDREKWFTDDRLPAAHQLPDVFYNKDNQSFDKGHIVRRDDVTWGQTYAEIERANGDTYHVTNCSPQVKGFNRSALRGKWGKLENLILKSVKKEKDKYILFAGPILKESDKYFMGIDDQGGVRIQIPEKYWKVVVVYDEDKVKCYGFILEQNLSDVELEFAVEGEWKNLMISIPELEEMATGLTFPPVLHESDQIADASVEAFCKKSNLERFGG